MRRLSLDDPKAFYKLFNKKQNNLDDVIDTFFNYFSELNKGEPNNVNEYIKSRATLLMPVYVKLLNTIFDNGVLPDEWHTGIIIPFF